MENENSLGGVQININKNTAIIVIKRLYTNVTVPFCDLLNTDTISEFLIKGVSFKYLHFQENKKKRKKKEIVKKQTMQPLFVQVQFFQRLLDIICTFAKRMSTTAEAGVQKGSEKHIFCKVFLRKNV